MTDGLRPMMSDDLQIASIMVAPGGKISYFGTAAEVLTGFRRNEVIGRDIDILLKDPLPENRRALAERPSDRAEVHQIRRADGTARAVEVYRHPVPQPGGPPATLILAVDVAESQEVSASLGLLNAFFQQSTVGFAILDAQLRYIAVNEALANLNRRPVVDHLGRQLREVISSADIDNYENMLQTVMDTGEPVTDLRLPTHPTSAPGEYHVMSVSWSRLEAGPDEALGLCGTVMDVTHSEKATLDAARSRAKLSLLSEVGARLGPTLDFRETTNDLTELLVTEFCDIALIDVMNDIVAGGVPPEDPDDDTLVTRIGSASRTTGPDTNRLLAVENPRPASTSAAVANVLMTNRPKLIQRGKSTKSLVGISDERAEAARNIGISSVIIAPLRARDLTLGALTVLRRDDRAPFNNEDVILVSEIASRAALSIDNSRLYRNERQTALTLQLSLLPQQLPDLPEVSLTHRYQPSRSDRRAGGDWFDTIELPGRRVAIVVGDVVGHSIQSAAAMGHFRTAVRSLASIGLDPAVLLTRLNDLATGFGENITATCVYLVYDPLRHSCAIASAGHPPPIVAPPDTAAEAREVAGGPLLGALPEAEYQATAMPTPPGTRLLLYTDGIVESRTTRLDDGIAQLERRMQSQRPASELCDQIMAASPSNEDDRTVLLAEFHGLSPHH